MRRFKAYIIVSLHLMLLACKAELPYEAQQGETDIYPDYAGVTIPVNLAPLNFKLAGEDMEGMAQFRAGDHELVISADNGTFSIPEEDWRALSVEAVGKEIGVTLYFREDGSDWKRMEFPIYVSADSIDSYLAYRRIFPGYRMWNEMGIYMRSLESFEEKAIITNNETNNSCMNCHTFKERSGEMMLFHQRGTHGGTYIVDGESVKRVAFEVDGKPTSFVYPYWHPSGRYVAFSTNETHQGFHQYDSNRIEVYDAKSDLFIYDLDRGVAFTAPSISSGSSFETFPTFTPDGRSLIFCSADSVDMPDAYRNVRYNLLRVDFSSGSGEIGERIDTLYNASVNGKSAAHPRVSPDGRKLLFTLSDYGTFPIWHKEADLYMMDMESGAVDSLSEINSHDVESYHSWSGNSRWMVFSSRRGDGLFTRPYIVHVDSDGKCAKPFLLPQERADYYDISLFSFNLPEFVNTPVTIPRGKLIKASRDDSNFSLHSTEGLRKK